MSWPLRTCKQQMNCFTTGFVLHHLAWSCVNQECNDGDAHLVIFGCGGAFSGQVSALKGLPDAAPSIHASVTSAAADEEADVIDRQATLIVLAAPWASAGHAMNVTEL